MRSKQDDMEKRMKEIERERHVMQDQFAKLSSTLSDSNHSLSSAQHSLQVIIISFFNNLLHL